MSSWEYDHLFLLERGYSLQKKGLRKYMTKKELQYIQKYCHQIFQEAQEDTAIVHSKKFTETNGGQRKDGTSRILYVKFGDDSIVEDPYISIEEINDTNTKTALYSLRSAIKSHLDLKGLPSMVALMGSPPFSDSQNFHLDGRYMSNAVIVPLTDHATQTQFLNVDSYQSQAFGFERWMKSLPYDWDDPTHGYTCFDSEILDFTLFNTTYPHRGPSNPTSEWRYTVFMSWEVYADEKERERRPRDEYQTVEFTKNFQKLVRVTQTKKFSNPKSPKKTKKRKRV